jgi:hypothetical protein
MAREETMNIQDDQAHLEEMESLYGERAKFSEYQAGQLVRYRDSGRELVGEITYVTAPGQTVRGTAHPTEYWIDGLTVCYSSDILGLVEADGDEKTLLPGQKPGLDPKGADKFNIHPKSVVWDDPKLQAAWDALHDDDPDEKT